MKVKFGVLGLVMILLVSVAVFLMQTNSFRPAPDVTFKTIDNQDIALSDLTGKPVIVTFWATDCRSCIEEIPLLIDLYRQYHHRGLEIIAVAMYYDPPSHVVEMRKIKQLPYPVALDLRAEHSRAFGDVQLTPTTFLLSPQGTIDMQKLGLFDAENMKARIEAWLRSS